MSKHTPGPWMIQSLETKRNGYDWPTFAIRSPKNHCLAIVGEMDNATAEDNHANARLIATAPELLEACRWAARGEHHSACSSQKHHTCNCYVGACQAAIAKAERGE